jgi:hypothetical protein
VSTGQGLAITAVAESLLAAVVAHWAAASDAVPLPPRRLILAGDPRSVAWDCEQLTVTLQGVGWGQALDASSLSPRAGTPASVMSLRHAVLVVSLVRCAAEADPRSASGMPTDAALHADGLRYMRDAGLLSQAMVAYTAKILPGLPDEASVQAGAIEPRGPEGAFHGLETTLAVTAGQLV